MKDDQNTLNAGKRRLPRWLKWTLEISVIILIFMLIRAWTAPTVTMGPAPPIFATDLNGEMVTLEQYRGQPLLVVFWAEWCRICKLELPLIQRVAEDWPVLTVAMQSGDDQAVRQVVEQEGLSGLRVANDATGELSRAWGVKGVPVMYILDSSGEIRFVETGLTSTWGLRARLWWAGRE
ncbi:MAG TPA: protein disulfide oxidoreductase [Halothiobacillus sp.]|nr:protein disulfide oxidoreductase [Halothiobacillus sp.]